MSAQKIIFLDAKGVAQRFISLEDRPRTIVETTMFEMLTQRGYKITYDGDDGLIAKLSITDCLIVFFEKTSGLTTDRVYKLLIKTREKNCNHCIIVYKDNVTTYVKNLIGNELFERSRSDKSAIHNTTDLDIEIFNEAELRINITKHRLQPKTVDKLSEVDTTSFKKKFGIKIPVFSITDPLVRFYNYKKGDIISLTRADGTKTYRIVK